MVSTDPILTAADDVCDPTHVKDSTKRSIDGYKAVKGIKIQSLGPIESRGIDAVFETKEQAERAKAHPSSLQQSHELI